MRKASHSMPAVSSASPAASPAWRDGWYWSGDGLRLHWRELDGPADRPTLLCLPGLTRTARDFEAFGAALAGRWRVVAVDLRGRGESAWPRDSLTYLPLTYRHDLRLLLGSAHIDRFVVIGSSIGGHLALELTLAHRAQMAGVILNDIGPDIAPAGLARLRANVGRQGNWPTWIHAARDLWQRNAEVYPDWGLTEWLVFAKRLCRVTASGRIVFDYDPRIADPFKLPHGDIGVDLWRALDSLKGLPVLSLRGALSDILTPASQKAMARRLPEMTMVEVPRVGHAPTLAEPAAATAVDALLERVLRGESK
jgi:pimeloyl-ACP methyl ester carboxylesterase